MKSFVAALILAALCGCTATRKANAPPAPPAVKPPSTAQVESFKAALATGAIKPVRAPAQLRVAGFSPASIIDPSTNGVIVDPYINSDGWQSWTARQAVNTELVIEVSTSAIGPWRVYDRVACSSANRRWGYSVLGPEVLFVRGQNVACGGGFAPASAPEFIRGGKRNLLQ